MEIRVRDIDPAAELKADYAAAVFASGYEARCTHIPRMLQPNAIRRTLVVGFDNLQDCDQRVENDQYFSSEWDSEPAIAGAGDDGLVLGWLHRTLHERDRTVSVLVDYSSMSRLWYAAILNWARHVPNSHNLEIDFLYSIGLYPNKPTSTPVIDEVLSIPGFEGGALGLGPTVLVVGLGFHGSMAQVVVEHIEPDILFGYLASPAPFERYEKRVRKENRDFIARAGEDRVLTLPLASVADTERQLMELAIPYMDRAEVVLVPMGPKPHVLASILVSMRLGQVACLRVSTRRREPEIVEASGDVVGTRVIVTK